jgi:hypothetical protein
MYGVCVLDQPTTMFRCDDGLQFDTKASQCKFVCKEEGIFPADGCRKFYECLHVGFKKYKLVERECPEGTIFNPKFGSCGFGNCSST